MDFEWDELKAEANLKKHGIDFEDAIGIFEGSVLVEKSDRDSEPRWKAIGSMGSIKIAINYTERGEYRRIISARRARSNERAEYYQTYPE